MAYPDREGWFALRRGWREMLHIRPQPFDEFSAALWAIENAAWKRHERWFNGQQVVLERGQLVTSRVAMMREFGWTLKRTRCFEERLKKVGFWAVERAPLYTVLTICNFDKISPGLDVEGHSNRPQLGIVGAQPGHTREQVKHEEHGKTARTRATRDRNVSRGDAPGWAPEPISFEEVRHVSASA